MSNSIAKALTRSRFSIKGQTLATVTAIVCAVALPQILHVVGAGIGAGSGLGETFLPMHLPVILVGLIAGPMVGGAVGLISPLMSFALTGMPSSAMVGFMMIELCVYGITAGLLAEKKMPVVGKVLIVQICGRAVRALAILGATYILGMHLIPVAVIWNSVKVGFIGIVIQLILIPVIMKGVEKISENE